VLVKQETPVFLFD